MDLLNILVNQMRMKLIQHILLIVLNFISETDGNFLFNTLNNIFGGKLTAEYIREEICDFVIKKKKIYEHLWESNLDNHITNMRKDEYLETNLKLLAFSDLMKLNNILH